MNKGYPETAFVGPNESFSFNGRHYVIKEAVAANDLLKLTDEDGTGIITIELCVIQPKDIQEMIAYEHSFKIAQALMLEWDGVHTDNNDIQIKSINTSNLAETDCIGEKLSLQLLNYFK